MKLSDTDKREVCPRCGWVGRSAFQQDRHDLCEAPPEDIQLEEEGEGDEDEADEVDEVSHEEGAEEEVPRWSRAAARDRGIPPKKTLPVRRITRSELAAGQAELRALGADVPYERPQTRGDCARVPRPCPYVACKYSLYLDVSETGSIILNFPHLEPGEMVADQSCALDLAEQGRMTLEDIAVVMNLTRERIRQVELRALNRQARPAAIALGLGPEDAAAVDSRRQVSPGADLEEAGVEGASPSDIGTILSRADHE